VGKGVASFAGHTVKPHDLSGQARSPGAPPNIGCYESKVR